MGSSGNPIEKVSKLDLCFADIAETILKKELSNKKEQEALVNSLIEKTDFSK